MGKDDGEKVVARRRRQTGRPLLTAGTATSIVSVMAGCTCGNLVPPPSQEVCFELDPPNTRVYEIDSGPYERQVLLDQEGCGLVHLDALSLRFYHSSYCTSELERSYGEEHVVVTLQPRPCPLPDMGVPDLGAALDQGVTDAGPVDAGANDQGLDSATADAGDGG